jgi:hypothetical protein
VREATRQVVALQAQMPSSPYVALWNRIRDFQPTNLDAAFADGAMVKANVLRLTLHAVDGDDYRIFREAPEPSLRAAKLDSRFLASSLTHAHVDAMLPGLLAYVADGRTAAECAAWLAERHGADRDPSGWHGIRQYAPLRRSPTGGPWSFDGRVCYRAPPDPPVLDDPSAHDRGLLQLVLRYLTGFGPATVADIAQFAMVQRGRVRQAIVALGDGVVRLDGSARPELYDLPGAELVDGDTPAPPRLLGMWDNLLLAHQDRARSIPDGYRKLVIRTNGDALPTLLVDGQVAGVWRSSGPSIEAMAFHPLPAAVWDELGAEAASLLAMFRERGDTAPFRRYDHWWAKLASGETRLLGA